MNKEQANAIVLRLRRWKKQSFLNSDIALLQSQVDLNENISFYLGVMLFAAFGVHKSLDCPGLFWSGLLLFAGLAFVVYCRLQITKLRKVIRFFQEQGPQKIEEIKFGVDA